jgi:hypothetical protein
VICAPALRQADGGLASAPAFFCAELRSGLRGAFYFLGENDGFGDLLHGFAGLAALLLESEVGLLFGGGHVALQDAFGAFEELASFEALGELGVGGFQARHFDFCADQEADRRDQLDVALFVNVRADVLEVDDSDETAAAEQRDGQECLVGILGQLIEELEARIHCSVARDGYGGAMFGDPAGDALADAQLQAIDYFLMGIFGGAQDEFFQLLDVDEAGIALHQGYGEFEDFFENFVEWVLAAGGDAAAQVVE